MFKPAGAAREAGASKTRVASRGGEDSTIVMELVEGATLAERIARGPVPLEEALPIARLIVDALEAAHEKGVNWYPFDSPDPNR